MGANASNEFVTDDDDGPGPLPQQDPIDSVDEDGWDALFHDLDLDPSHSGHSGDNTNTSPAGLDGWDDILDEDLAQPASPTNTNIAPESEPVEPIIKKPGKGKGRGGGRPRGSREFREAVKQQNQIDAFAPPAEDLFRRRPLPGSIEYAREARAMKLQVQARNRSRDRDAQIVIPDAAATALRKYGPVSDMVQIGTDIQKDVMHCVKSSFQKSKGADQEDVLIDHMLTSPMTTISVSAVEQQLQKKNLGRRMLAISSAMLELSYFLWGMLLSIVIRLCQRSGKAMEPVMILLKLRYDETPTKVRVTDPGNPNIDFSTASAEEALAAVSTEQSSVRAKVFQTEFHLGVLLKSNLPQDSCKPYKWISGQLPTSLQALSSGSGECIHRALLDVLQSVPELDRARQMFPLRLRHSCCDRYTGNYKAERLLRSNYGDFDLCHMTCDIHKLYSCVEAATSCMEFDVSGILSIGVGISPDVSCIKDMRQIITRILANKLAIRYSEPPEGDAVRYRKELFDRFLPLKSSQRPGSKPQTRANALRRWVIAAFLNGHMGNKSEIEHYCVYGCCASPEDTLKKMALYLTWALVPRKCPKYARSRWTGWIEAVEWCGLLGGVHNLLEDIILAYTGTVKKNPAKPTNCDGFDEHQDEWEQLMIEEGEQEQAGGGPHVQHAPIQRDVAPLEGVPINLDASEGLSADAAISWAEFNQQSRGNASSWVQSDPYPRLVVLKEVSQLLMALMHRFLAYSGAAWERKQQAQAAKGKPRTYAVCVAATGADVQETMQQLSGLFFCVPGALLMQWITPQLRARRFQMISAALCSLHVLLRLPRKGCPYALFKAWSEGDMSSLASIPQCMWDELTHFMHTRYDSKMHNIE